MKTAAIVAAGIGLALPASASTGREGHGLIGYGIQMYNPTCAFACQSSISNPLDCPDAHHDMEGMVMKRMSGMHEEKPSPECYANNVPYLQTLAYCMYQYCADDVANSTRDQFFEMSIGGRMKQPPKPLYSYSEALLRIDRPPTNTTPAEEMLMEVSLVAEEDYLPNFNGNYGFERAEGVHSRYGIIVMATGIAIPIAASLLRFLPLPMHLGSRLNAYLNYPPAMGSRHSTPLLNLMIMPTRGQSLFLFYLVAINIILCSVGFESRQPNSWFASTAEEIRSLVANRTGVLSLVNLALSVLYAGRNNFLIFLTDWPHSTYLLLHRWAAGIATLQACIHSAIYLHNYLQSGDHATEAKLDYWVWGVVATLAMTILLPTSILPLRQKAYEIFLAWHVIVAFFAILGCYLHIFLRFERQWGYELWVYLAFAFWAFDRVMRFVRLARNGICKAKVTVIDEDYIRLDVAGVTGEGQAYLYFPTLTWRVWENHPFSIAGGFLHINPDAKPIETHVSSSASSAHASPTTDIEKHPTVSVTPTTKPHTPTPTTTPHQNLTFIIRTHTGTTSLLRTRASLPLLLESPYPGSLLHPTHAALNAHPRLLCIAGGVGITALLPLLAAHRGARKLAWGVRNESLLAGLRDLTEGPGMAGVRVRTSVGARLDVRALVEEEAGRVGEGSLAVVVSGPPGMADEVRAAVVRVVRGGGVVGFWEESYSW